MSHSLSFEWIVRTSTQFSLILEIIFQIKFSTSLPTCIFSQTISFAIDMGLCYFCLYIVCIYICILGSIFHMYLANKANCFISVLPNYNVEMQLVLKNPLNLYLTTFGGKYLHNFSSYCNNYLNIRTMDKEKMKVPNPFNKI